MSMDRKPKSTESVCIQTDRIYDSCKSKECAEDLRVYFSEAGQAIINNANGIRLKCAEVLYVDTDVEKVQFNRCCYNVSMTFYFKVIVEIADSCHSSTCVEGLCIYNKNAMLFGSEVCSYVFSSKDSDRSGNIRLSRNANLPTAIVETIDPIALDAKLTEICQDCHKPVCSCCCSGGTHGIPGCIQGTFPDGLVENCSKRVYVTLGLFIFVRLQRNTQLLIPCYDFCIPTKECVSATCGNDPCSFFEKLEFPIDSFFPPEECCDNNPVSGCASGGCGGNGCTTTVPFVSNGENPPFNVK